MTQAGTRAQLNTLTAGVLSRLRSERGPAPVIGAAILVFVIFSIAAPDNFPTPINMQAIGFQLPETALLGLAVMLSMVVAGIDLSVVAIADLSGVAMVEYFKTQHAGMPGHGGAGVVVVGILIALGVGLGCGLVNGLLIGKLGITAILATLATMELYGGLAIAWTGGQPVLAVPSSILNLGTAEPGGVPAPSIIFIICALLVALLLNGSRFGLRSMLVGANPKAARLSGINEPRVQMGTYMASGLLSAVAGIIIIGRTASATPDFGSSYILVAVVIAVLAGVDPAGGFGTVLGVVLAAFTLNMIQSGFVALNMNQFLYQAAQGLILILVLALNSFVRGDKALSRRMRSRFTSRHGPPGPSGPPAPAALSQTATEPEGAR